MSLFFHSRHLITAMFFLLSISATPAPAGVNLSVGTGYLAGDTQYQIGGRSVSASGTTDYHFPLSELNFPLDSFILKGNLNVEFTDKWSLMANAATNITDGTGKMEDSDWLIPGRLDVYSESDTEMDALLLEGKVSYVLYQGYYGQTSVNNGSVKSDIQFFYAAGLGYKYQKFDFDVSNLHQWYPSDPARLHIWESGLVLTYEAEYQIPYLELGMAMNAADKFILELGLAYAPLVNFQDEDNHLLRHHGYLPGHMVNIADHDWNGTAKFINLKGRYNFNPRWHLEAEVEAMNIESEGRSNTYYGGVWLYSIKHEIVSRQYSAYISLGYTF